jgi:hypothetical protein
MTADRWKTKCGAEFVKHNGFDALSLKPGHYAARTSRKLDPQRFVRVHRSAIVNIESLLQLEPISHGEFHEVLKTAPAPE